jgi:LysR family positive regulator for ilvC
MDEKSLRLFIALSEQKHFARAASECNVSSSAASRALSRIEVEVGVLLVERDNRRVEFTSTGKQFLDYAKATLANWHELKQNIHLLSASPKGRLSLYCSVTASYSLLSTLLPPLRQQYPDIQLRVHTGDQAASIQRVLSGEDDLAIAALPKTLNSRLYFKSLTPSSLQFVAPVIDCAINKVLEEGLAGKIDWSEVPFILSESGLTRDKVNDWFGRQQLKPNIYAQVRGHEAIVGLVALGFGVAAVPQLVLDNSPLKSKVRVLGLTPELEPIDVGIVCLKKRLNDPLVKAFWGIL